MWAILTTVAAFVPLAVWGLRFYLNRSQTAAVQAERQAGADASQVDAQNADIKRTEDAANAGAAAGRLPIDTPDIYDRDR